MSDSIPEPPGPGLGLSERFFREAREAMLDRRDRFEFSADDILAIARDTGLRTDFERRFLTEVNDPELRRLIVRFLEEAAISLEQNAEAANDGVETLDKAGLTVAAPVTVAGAGAIIATAASLGSIVFLAAGLAGLISLGIARHLARGNARYSKYSAMRVRGLIRHLEASIGGDR